MASQRRPDDEADTMPPPPPQRPLRARELLLGLHARLDVLEANVQLLVGSLRSNGQRLAILEAERDIEIPEEYHDTIPAPDRHGDQA